VNEASLRFHGVLFDERAEEVQDEPEFFRDFNLDRIVNAVATGRDQYNLKPLFYTRLTNPAAVGFRHDIFHDLRNEALLKSIMSFCMQMRRVREHVATAAKAYYKYEKQGWFLDAVEIYGETVENLLQDLSEGHAASGGLIAFRDYVAGYVAGAAFKKIVVDARKLKSDLSEINYCLLIRGNAVTVQKYEGQADYSAVVEETFAKFKEGAAKDYRVQLTTTTDMNHVEALVVERVALLYPDVFRALEEFSARNESFLDETIAAFDRGIQFYIAWLEFIEKFKRNGLKFCYPKVSKIDKNVSGRDSFDLALADKLVEEKLPIVCNDFVLAGAERILVVTGPNQGGKTTFARMFGQLHYLASLGCPIPGAEASLFLCDELLAHFEREEDVTTLRGKLQDDLIRIHEIFERATSSSIIIINEIFSSTTLEDAVYLARQIIECISQLDAVCVCVTFLDEVASCNEKTVSLVAGVVPENPTLRTYRIEKRPADGLSYSLAIAEKYGLTQKQLRERITV
jgi:DNA mismatch repair protein MutS